MKTCVSVQSLVLALVLPLMSVLVVGAPPAAAQSACPNLKATQLPGSVETGDSVNCVFGIEIFGIKIGVGGVSCPTKKWTYPPRQACQGDANPGTYCVVEGVLDVTLESCACHVVGTDELALLLPDCVCRNQGYAGTVEDFQTQNCPTP